jgi:2-C-methyl-D-erythritol 4-phosphate cytidylyltransferase
MVQFPKQSAALRARHVALIPAAGSGARMGSATPKQYLELRGQSLLMHAIHAFQNARHIDAIAVVVAPGDDQIDRLTLPAVEGAVEGAGEGAVEGAGEAAGAGVPKFEILRVGGATRRDSVLNGLRALRASPFGLRDHDRVVVHDAARAGIRPHAIDALLEALADDPIGGILALPVVDTVKRVQAGRILKTEARETLWLAQTPQVFAAGVLQAALERHADVSDEARALELEGYQVRVVEGTRGNLKVTLAEDLRWLEAAWEVR